MATQYRSDLIAGGGNGSGEKIGSVILDYIESENDSGSLKVTYQLDADGDADTTNDWNIDNFHFDFGKLEGDIPVNKAQNPVIGQFDYSSANTPYTILGDGRSISFTIDNVNKESLGYWSAHAEASILGADGAFSEALATPTTASIKVAYPGTSSSTPAPSYFDTTISGSSISWLNGTFDGWCVDTGRSISPGASYQATKIYNSLDEEALSGLVEKWKNLSAVNWLINNFEAGDQISDEYSYGSEDASFDNYTNGGPVAGQSLNPVDPVTGAAWDTAVITKEDMQHAIWALIENDFGTGSAGPSPRPWVADELADRAYFSGADYKPPCNGEVAVVLDAPGSQTTIIELAYAKIGMGCSRDETAWGVANDGYSFMGKSWADFNSFGKTLVSTV
jgi:hypothetical protein